MYQTSGGTVQASFWRIVGTLVGAFVGWAALAAGDGSPYLLAVFAVILGMFTQAIIIRLTVSLLTEVAISAGLFLRSSRQYLQQGRHCVFDNLHGGSTQSIRLST